MRIAKTIDKSILYSMTAVAVISILISGSLTVSYMYKKFHLESENLRKSYIDNQKAMIKNEVEKAIDYIEYMKSKTEDRLKEQIKNRAHEAYNIAMNVYKQNIDNKSQNETAKLIKDALRPIRFNNGRGYFFSTNFDGIEMLFADRPELEGKDLLEMQDTHGKYVIKDMIGIAKTQNEGFYRYVWTKPNSKGKDFPKIAYIKNFEPLKWFIGTGEYLDDVESDIKSEILERIAKIRFGKDGYIFVVSFDGTTLMNDTQRHLIGKNIWELTDPNGVKVIQEERKAVENPNGGYIKYVWNKPTASKPSPKISFMKGVHDWEWMVGAGIYVDEAEETIQANKALLESEVRNEILKISFVLVILIVFLSILARYISNNIKKSVQTFSEFFKNAATESIKIDPQKIHFVEFKNLASSANWMVDQRIGSEDSLRKSKERLKLALSGADLGTWDWHVPSGAVTFDERWADMLGYALDEIEPHVRAWETLVHQDDMPHVMKTLTAHLEGKTDAYETEHRLRHKSGKWIWVLDRGCVTERNEQGKALRACGTHLDITERKWTEKALLKSEMQFRQVFEHIGIGIAIYQAAENGNDFIFVDINPAGAKMGQKPRTEHIGKSVLGVYPGVRDLGLFSVFQEVWRSGIAKYHATSQYKDDKIAFWVDNYVSRLPSGEIMAVYEDVTTRKEVEETLKNLNLVLEKRVAQRTSELAETNKELEDFVYSISHDLRAPLRSISGFAQIIDRRHKASLNEEGQHYFDNIIKAGRQMGDLIDDLLKFSRLGRKAIQSGNVSLGDVFKTAVETLSDPIKNTDAQINIPENMPVIQGDITLATHIFINLLENAVKYHQPNVPPVIDVGFEVEDPYVVVSVADNGIGIVPEYHEKIFNIFQRLHSQSDYPGTGIGLAAVKKAVQIMGGQVWVESEPGKGSVFKIKVSMATTA